METFREINKPSKAEQQVAIESYDALESVISQLKEENPEIEIEETQERIKIPLSALKLLSEILNVMRQGKPFSLVPMSAELTTQKAAEMLGCSRPHIVKLLEQGTIKFTMVGRHRRIRFEDVLSYKKQMKENQLKNLTDIMKSDEELGMYDS